MKILFFTKAPTLNFAKQRLSPYLDEKSRLELARKLIKDNYAIVTHSGFDSVICYAGDSSNLDFIQGRKKAQNGDGLGERMKNAMFDHLESGPVLLVGSDLIGMKREHFEEAFQALKHYDVVFSPTKDGGYGLVGMNQKQDVFTGITYSRKDVLEHTIRLCEKKGWSYYLLPPIRDVDTLHDLVEVEFGEEVRLLGAGEYNINYLAGNRVIRINFKSQMNLPNQIEYEYRALKVLESSGVTPKAYCHRTGGEYLKIPFLTMEYIEGRPLDYRKDMGVAAYLLSKIHNLRFEPEGFVIASKPFAAMYDEFLQMYRVYRDWERREESVVKKIDRFLGLAKESGLDDEIEDPCIINTELNNRNFIIDRTGSKEKSRIIDWEKPIIGECEQDLAHFLVPTTTHWKTDTILCREEMMSFLKQYERYRKVNYKKFFKYLMFNSLRGITWCSMALVEYSQDRAVKNEDTLFKIKKFLSPEFLDRLDEFYEVNHE